MYYKHAGIACVWSQMNGSGDCERHSVNELPDVAKGAEIFRMRCATCHTTEEVSFFFFF